MTADNAQDRNPAASQAYDKSPTDYGCDDCGWPWPFRGKPPARAQCNECGGELVPRWYPLP